MPAESTSTSITLEQFWEIWERFGDGWDFDLCEPGDGVVRITLGGVVLDASVKQIRCPTHLVERLSGQED